MNEKWPEIEDIISKIPGNPTFIVIEFDSFCLFYHYKNKRVELIEHLAKDGGNNGTAKPRTDQ